MKKLIIILITGFMASIAVAADEPFNGSIQILTALNITEQSALNFPDTNSQSSSQTVVVTAADAGPKTS